MGFISLCLIFNSSNAFSNFVFFVVPCGFNLFVNSVPLSVCTHSILNGNLFIIVTSEENDFLFDEIGSVLKIKQIQSEKRELLEALELYYRIKFLDEDINNPG